jgi:hypothetical protein
LVTVTEDRIDTSTLQQYGPALVSAFSVYEDFESHSGSVFKGQPVGCLKGLNAMVLIGVRGGGSRRQYLLQNWWRRCQFVEADLEDLQACNPRICFVETPQESIPPNWPAVANLYDETSFVDKPESERYWRETRNVVTVPGSFQPGACDFTRLKIVCNDSA